jgi:AbrB family looped-hinge helix DNA binding protein
VWGVDFPYSIPYCAGMKATLTSKGQITIPLPIRRKLKLHKGAVLEFDEEADYLKATKCVDADRMRAVIGIAKKELAGKSVAEWMETLRGPAQLPPRKRRR